MAIKTYINGSENGTITFKGDTEPCAVYVNGERQDNISYIPQEVKGEKSVRYKSEYKKNIRTLSIEGNTYQKTEESSPIIEQAISSGDFTSTGSNFIAYYITTEQFTALQEWATDKGYTGNFNLFVSVKNAGEIPTGFAVVVGSSLDDILVGGISTTAIYYKSDSESKGTATINLSNTVYVGIGNTNEGVGDNASEYLNLFLSNFTLLLQPTEYKGMPSPENPSAVSNSNDNGMVVTLQGKNLFDYDNVKFSGQAGSTYMTITKINNGFKFVCTTKNAFAFTTDISAFHLKPNTKYTSRAIVTLINNGSSNLSEAGSMSMSLLLQTIASFDSSGRRIYMLNGYQKGISTTPGTHEIITTFTTPADMTDFKYVSTRLANNTTVIFQDLQIELGDTSSEYEPYFNKTVQIPSSVVLPDGTSLEMRLAKVGDKVDRLIVDRNQGKVTYEKNVGYKKPPASQGFGRYNTKYEHGVLSLMLEQSLWRAKGYCTYEKVTGTEQGKMWLGVGNPYVYWIGILDRMGMTLDEFKEWFAEIQSGDSPFIIEYALESPVEYDITDTEVGQNMLALSAYTKNLTNIIEMTPNDTANPDVSSISVSYAKWGANLNN